MSAFSVVEGDDCRARTKETAATLKSVTGAAERGGRGELVDAVARELAGELRRRKRPIAGFRPQRATAGVEILHELREGQPDRVRESRAGRGGGLSRRADAQPARVALPTSLVTLDSTATPG